LAERFQTPVFVATDLDIGMNDWMVKRFQWDDSYRPDRGKVLDAAALEKVQKFSRYHDVDGDGIAARTLPGVGGKGAYFVRGSGHDKHAAYTEDSDAYQELVDRLKRKFEFAATAMPKPAMTTQPGAEIGLVTIGGCDAAVREAADKLKALGITVDVMRIRGFPFGAEVKAFFDSHEQNFVIEQNRDAQLRALLAIELGIPRDAMTSILDYGGMPLTAKVVVDAVSRHLAGTAANGVPA
jgi:2-oxoglutarate ferredoxin oxidoreductase subunit alpha